MSKNFDPVKQPEHYTSGKYECWDVMEDVFGVDEMKAFCRLCAFKYIWRSERKNGVQDLEKARVYIDRLIDLETNRFNAPSADDDDEIPFK